MGRNITVNDFRAGVTSSMTSVLMARFLFLFLLDANVPPTECHISSILGTGYRKIQVGKHLIYCNYGPMEDGKPPLLSHIRVLRGPASPSFNLQEDAATAAARLNFLKPPSFQHKFLYRNPQFPGGFQQTNSEGGIKGKANDIDTRPNLTVKEAEKDNNEPPDFTPLISARVLSNIPEFFQHLRDNLAALQDEDSYESGENWESPRRRNWNDINYDYYTESELSDPTYAPIERDIPWQNPKVSLNMKENTKNNHGSQGKSSEDKNYLKKANNYNPAWLYTNLGLGKRNQDRK